MFIHLRFILFAALTGLFLSPQIGSGQIEWTRVRALSPHPRSDHTLVYDSFRKQVVLFGGLNADFNNDTWVWNGLKWKQLDISGPRARAEGAMAYDSIRGKLMLFGGFNATGYLSDVWQLDKKNWKKLSVKGPPGRNGHDMVFAKANGKMITFGGWRDRYLSDTWMLGKSRQSKSEVDLTVVSIKANPGSLILGEKFSVTLSVSNNGKSRSPISTANLFIAKKEKNAIDFAVGSTKIPQLISRQTKSLNVFTKIPFLVEPGLYELKVILDEGNLISEKNKRNNSKAVKISIRDD